MATISLLRASLRPLRLASARRILARAIAQLVAWDRRARERQHLRTIDDRALADLGLTRADLLGAVERRLWRD